ncbi:DUF262 domain-containing protein [Oscillatoria sp. FACHB-1406]|uniref:DUF262 domain-containing protein n=1 Tax=Oscillatoria sp. FACHB-1406 TaxID=2692846 RepID=UPI0016836D56|nr:DUF262 domain-containing protein [Oscillatoria sp. FACHB-1406]MBD2577913.1 DUF262 domain-containing protein [Oscillatoria sp. FACHB-1406]
MNIEPAYTSIGNLFSYKPMFFIPKYQRAYAWNAESVSDFIKDLKKCFEKRRSDSPVNHFFGGILSVKHSVPGTVNQHKYEIIDGQQRIATFTLLVACLVKSYKELQVEANGLGDTDNESIIKGRIEKLSERFIEFSQEVQRVVTPVEVLELSKADRSFYKELIRDIQTSVSRDSHNKILYAYNSLRTTIQSIIASHARIEDKIDDLEIVQNILDNDFTILHMVTGSREDAFRLFQVINDRGTNLTDGDLLRAKTLELLEGFNQQQDAVERMWDEILADPPADTKNYLNWIYESYQGNRPQQNALFDMFLDKFFPQNQQISLTLHHAQQIHETVKNIHEDIIKCRKLIKGQWLYSKQQPITGWDITRLNILLVELGHDLSIPLFLAAAKLDHRLFSEIVQIVERTFFRYKIICNQHATPLKGIYYQESLAIRQDPNSYTISNIKTKLQNLISTKATDSTFKNALNMLEYKESGGNKPLKYFLMTVEYYYQWYKNGAAGVPVCVDKSRVYDFAGTSIEHVYPRNSGSSVLDSNLEPLKNTLGNLTIMDPGQNTLGGNDPFMCKAPLYQQSSVLLTQEIGSKTTWTQIEINDQKELLIDAALKIFIP